MLENLIDDVLDEFPSKWRVGFDSGLSFCGHICVPNVPEIKR